MIINWPVALCWQDHVGETTGTNMTRQCTQVRRLEVGLLKQVHIICMYYIYVTIKFSCTSPWLDWFSWYCSSCFDSCSDSFPRSYNYWGCVRLSTSFLFTKKQNDISLFWSTLDKIYIWPSLQFHWARLAQAFTTWIVFWDLQNRSPVSFIKLIKIGSLWI